MHQRGAEAEDDDGEEKLETADDGNPERRLENIVGWGLFLMRLDWNGLHCGGGEVVEFGDPFEISADADAVNLVS